LLALCDQTAVIQFKNKYALHCFILILLEISLNFSFAQNDSTKKLNITGYVEAYHCYDVSNPSSNTRPSFIYSHNKHNEFALNLGFIKMNYQLPNFRANGSLMTGSYAQANLANEPGLLKMVFEANLGFKLSATKNRWLDIGVFPSHIGFESAIGKDCWTLTRSILADNSPYYESGLKITSISNDDKWLVSFLVLNGWQRIYLSEHYTKPSFGHQLTYKPTSNILLNSSSFVGFAGPDSLNQLRYFHNFYGVFQLHEKFAVTAGLDIGSQQDAKARSIFYTWYTPVLILKYSPLSKLNIAGRVEWYDDRHQQVIATNSKNGFQTYGYSLNLDYSLNEHIVFRIEGRGLKSKDAIFTMNQRPSKENYFFTAAMAISF
jgi:hypothetical protein